jgi:hypothetical protein
MITTCGNCYVRGRYPWWATWEYPYGGGYLTAWNLRPVFWQLPDVYSCAKVGTTLTPFILLMDVLMVSLVTFRKPKHRRSHRRNHAALKSLAFWILLLLTAFCSLSQAITWLETQNELHFWRTHVANFRSDFPRRRRPRPMTVEWYTQATTRMQQPTGRYRRPSWPYDSIRDQLAAAHDNEGRLGEAWL